MSYSAKIVLGPCYGQIITAKDFLNELRLFFSFQTDKRVLERDRRAKKRDYYIGADGLFFVGLAGAIYKLLKEIEIPVEIEDRRGVKDLPSEHRIREVIDSMPFTLRDYQEECVRTAASRPNGIIHMGTGAGKGVVLASLIDVWDKRTIIPLKSTDLMDQLRNEVSEYLGIPLEEVGQIGGGRFNPQDITVGIVNSLITKKGLNFLKGAEVMITDECHNGMSNMYSKVQAGASKCSIRYGFSATPWQPKRRTDEGWEECSFDIESRFGPVIYKKSVSDLIQDGWLSTPRFIFIRGGIDYKDGNELRDYKDELPDEIVNNRRRNLMACKITRRLVERGKKVLFFVSRLDHGENLYEMLKKLGLDEDSIVFANGQNIISNRKEAISDFKQDVAQVLIGTDPVVSEGLNFIIDACFNMSAGRSSKAIIQKGGRILRKPRASWGDVDRDEHREVLMFDFFDGEHPVFASQARSRIETINKEGLLTETMSYREAIDMVKSS